MVYFLKTVENNYIKIGYTKFKDLVRLRQMESLHPFKGEIVLFIEGNTKLEKELHNKFKELLVSGKNEWFVFGKEIEDFITDNIKNTITVPLISKERKSGSGKTSQIGVRFDKDLLESVVKGGLARSPQRALNIYEKTFVESDEKTKELEKKLEEVFEKHKDEIDKLTTDILHGGVAISKTDTDGNMKRIDPESKEGLEVRQKANESIFSSTLQDKINTLEGEKALITGKSSMANDMRRKLQKRIDDITKHPERYNSK